MADTGKSCIAILAQELIEDGSVMHLPGVHPDELIFLKQAFVADTIMNALRVPKVSVRLYHTALPERKKLIKRTIEYLRTKSAAAQSMGIESRLTVVETPAGAWGGRVEAAFEDLFAEEFQRGLLLGTRSPTVSGQMLQDALTLLSRQDVVFGPTPEGRYYAIGQAQRNHVPFASFDWTSPSIYASISDRLSHEQISWSELDIWYTVETPDELELMVRDINQFRFEGDEITAHESEAVVERIIARL